MERDSSMEANRKALQVVLATATVRDSTRYLLEAIYLDTKPRDAAVVDFGIDSAQHLNALAVPVLKGEITPQQLDQALGNGAMLTRLAREAPSSVDNQITFDMPWYQLLREQLPAERAVNLIERQAYEADSRDQGSKKSLAELKAEGQHKQPGRQKSRDKGMER